MTAIYNSENHHLNADGCYCDADGLPPTIEDLRQGLQQGSRRCVVGRALPKAETATETSDYVLHADCYDEPARPHLVVRLLLVLVLVGIGALCGLAVIGGK